jgi:hypothetical protein
LSRGFYAALAVIAIVTGFIAIAFSGSQSPKVADPGASRAEVPLITLPQADGGTFSSAALQGRSPLILNFFATW